MIAFGSAITKRDEYERFAVPGIRRAAEPDSEVIAHPAEGSIFRNYNLILENAGALDDLEALVLIHQDAEIVDPDFCRKVREALSDPDVGVVGCVGAIGVRSIAWWEGSVTWASFIHRHGKPGEEFPSLSWDPDDMPPYAQLGEVDTVDGFVMALSPWTVRNIRFDESLGQLLHGYDFDFCLQVREAGRKVVTADLRVVHNHSLELANDPDGWVKAHMTVAEKWDGRMPNVGVAGGDWKQRARRAEAERAAARAQAISTQLQTEARSREHERALKEATESIGWRITAPLRLVEASLAARRKRRG
jgi:Glycosyltransferase like family